MHLGMSYSEIRTIPVAYRQWFVKRLIKHFDDANKRQDQVATNKNSSERAKISGSDIDNFENAINRKFS
jgi:hypothetical protein